MILTFYLLSYLCNNIPKVYENIILGTVFMVVMSTLINIPSISMWALGGSVIRNYLTNRKLKNIIECLLAILLVGTAISIVL